MYIVVLSLFVAVLILSVNIIFDGLYNIRKYVVLNTKNNIYYTWIISLVIINVIYFVCIFIFKTYYNTYGFKGIKGLKGNTGESGDIGVSKCM